MEHLNDADDHYLIWISNGQDSVAVGPDGFIPRFRDMEVLRRYATLNKQNLEDEEPILHDLEWVAAWVGPKVVPFDCNKILAAWNLFGDVATSLGEPGAVFRRMDSQFRAIYNKLFWGNNLPSVTPEGSRDIPEWSSDELDSLVKIMISGLELFASYVRAWSQRRSEDRASPDLYLETLSLGLAVEQPQHWLPRHTMCKDGRSSLLSDPPNIRLAAEGGKLAPCALSFADFKKAIDAALEEAKAAKKK